MNDGGMCVPSNRFKGTRLATLKKINCSTLGSTETVQFDPTSRLVTPGSVGGTFRARTQVLAVTLPSLHNEYYVPSRSYRKQTVSSIRFVPTTEEWTPLLCLTSRDRLKVEYKLLEMAKERSRLARVVPHRSEQPYLMAGFPVKLQSRARSAPDGLRGNLGNHLATPKHVFPPQPSLVNEEHNNLASIELLGNYPTASSELLTSYPNNKNSAFSLPNANGSGVSELFLTQTTLDPIIMEDITVTKSHNYRSPCSLLGRETVTRLSTAYRQIAPQTDTLSYSLAEQLVTNTLDPSYVVQILDVNKDGQVDIAEYVVVMAISQHISSTWDHLKVEKRLKSLKVKYSELETSTIPASVHSFSRLLISDTLMESILALINCNPTASLSFLEYLCLFKFWEELEDDFLEEEESKGTEIADFLKSYLGSTDSTFSFDDVISSTCL